MKRLYLYNKILPPPASSPWLADDIDEFRHLERSSGVGTHALDRRERHRKAAPRQHADAHRGRCSLAEFEPDHILIALRSSEHANWQGRRIIERIEARFGLPATTYTVDPQGTYRSVDTLLLLCFVIRTCKRYQARRRTVRGARRPCGDGVAADLA